MTNPSGNEAVLYVLATPIGNLGDVSLRAIEILRQVDAIACEDTRRARILLTAHNIPAPRLVSYREHTEQKMAPRLVAMLLQGSRIALCTNAGYPGIRDPGYRVISQAADAGISVQVIPGPGAVEVALLTSGLPTSSFTFKGFPPRKPGALRRFFDQEKDLPHTLVFFESPMRIAATLAAALVALGNRRGAVCVELTKKFERVERGFLSDLARAFSDRKVKGEVTLVIAGNNPKFLGPRR